MTNRLTIRINVEDGIAVVSRTAARNGSLAIAAAAGSQFLAVTAAAQPVEVGGGEDLNPIFYPEMVIGVCAAAAGGGLVGAVVGVLVTRRSGGKKKKDDE